MTKNDIIEWLYIHRIVELACCNYKQMLGDLWDDFLQENFLIYIVMPDEKLIGLYERNELKPYIYRIAHNQATNPMSKFWRTHKNKYKTVNQSYESIEWLESNKNDQNEDN